MVTRKSKKERFFVFFFLRQMSDAAAPPVAGDVPKENVAAVDEQAAPQVNPEDLPKVSLDILLSVHEAQSVHGLRRNVPDYQRYRKYG